ncbi:GNAT family N-acetyltransferase [Alkalihalobacillus pseudalcaliphilus]|uniref:GNAT family N-acetyltransferase n=1 Tax=Alkalihalobacillus pseudalcaliphilus TaxID=79884 RepID=UPI00064DDECA|nr:GNAT family N-acetyltransferase [Alkalihalobacillus pseudalcaliphilus]KMK75784.1 hypothetical protein AB990_10980 [Alkalihalobacillus pseudalcaliphilus]
MFETTRCLIRQLENKDLQGVLKLYSSEEVRRYLGGTMKEESVQKAFSERLSNQNDWVVFEKKSNDFIGMISLDTHHNQVDLEISYQFLPNWWGQGFAKETLPVLIQFAFSDKKITRLVAETQTANLASCRLLESLGMKELCKLQRFGSFQTMYSILPLFRACNSDLTTHKEGDSN